MPWPRCSPAAPASKSSAYQGYVEGEYVHVASPVAGRLDKLQVQRGQTVEAKAPLFELEAEQELAAKQQADEQLNAAQAQLADLKVGQAQARSRPSRRRSSRRRRPPRSRRRCSSSATRRSSRPAASRSAQLEDSRANQAIKAARVRELAGQLEVSRLPAREDQIRAQSAQVAAARAAPSQAAWRLDQKRAAASQAGLVADTLYREGEWVAAGSPVVRLLPPGEREGALLRAGSRGRRPQAGPQRSASRCDGCGADVAGDGELRRRTSPSSRRRSSTATRRAPSWCSWSRRGRRAENAPRLHPGQPVDVTLQ